MEKQAPLSSNERLTAQVVRRYLLPGILAQLGARVSLLIDSVIIGWLLGGEGLTVMGLVAPVDLVFMSVGSLIGVGASVNAGLSFGAGDKEKASGFYTLAVFLSAGLGVLLSLSGLVFTGSLASLLGVGGSVAVLVTDYLHFYMFGGAFAVLVYLPLNFLRLVGRPGAAMTMLLLMSGVNTAFSLLFAVGLGLGVAGIALGTAAAYIVTFVYGQMAYARAKSGIRLRRFGKWLPQLRVIAVSGSPSALNNVLRAGQTALINLLFVSYGAVRFLPAYSLYNTVLGLISAAIFGISQSVLPLAGIAYGERDFRMVTDVVKKVLRTGSVIIAALALLLIAVRNRIGYLFGLSDPETLMNAGTAFLFLAFCMNLYLVNNIASNFFVATKRPRLAILIVVCRLFLFSVLPAFFLYGFLGENGVWAGFVTGEVLTLAVLFAVTRILRKRRPSLSPLSLLDGSLVENRKVIDFSVQNTLRAASEAAERIGTFYGTEEQNSGRTMVGQAMAISLAVEEIVVLVGKYALASSEKEYIDIRIVSVDENTVMRIRYGGKEFNPLLYCRTGAAASDDYMGIGMIAKMAKTTEYSRTFGINNLLVGI
ncbi:MAG: hypothetical protein LBQ15_02465 [Clostridium sp.]|nr:hypothetical protein [Clostridium sp.]